jgi:hypothetical protein
MKLLPQLILIGAGVALLGFLPKAAHAVSCQVAPKGGFGGVTPELNCGPPPGAGSQFIIPAADIPMCGSTPCYSLTVLPSTAISLPATATPAWGTTVAQVQQLMPYNIMLNFEENPNIDAAITATGDVELARLSTELARNDTSDYTLSIMAYAGEKLSAANLRLQAAFGPTWLATAISWMPAATLSQYNALPVYAPIPLSGYWAALNPSQAATFPNDGALYLYDLLLDEKTASAGETTTVAGAAVSRYVSVRIKNAVVVIAVVALVVGVASFALQLYDSPSMNNLANSIAANYFAAQMVWTNGARVIIQMPPGFADIPPQPIDPGPVPAMPAVEGDTVQNGASACTNPDNCPTSAT